MVTGIGRVAGYLALVLGWGWAVARMGRRSE